MLHTRFPVACAAAVLASMLTPPVCAQNEQFQSLTRMTLTTDADSAFGIAVGDVNGDGAPDYFIANLNTSQLSRLYLNDGNGNFTDVSAANLPTSILSGGSAAMGDIDGDGDVDIVQGAYPSTQRMQVLLNDGTGKFADNTATSMPTLPTDLVYDMKLGDVDLDRDLDLVCAAASGSSRLFLNNGKGVFTDVTGSSTFPSVGGGHWGVALIDLQGDFDLDIVLHSSGSLAPIILINTNFQGTYQDMSSTLLPSGFTTTSGRKVVAADFDGDGTNDLFFGSYTQQNRLLLWDKTSKNFKDATTTHMPVLADNTYMLAAGDIDGDGDVDVVSGNYSAAGVLNTVYLNDGTGKFQDASSTRHANILNATTAIALADVDQDGDLDTIAGNWTKPNEIIFNLHRHVYATAQPMINQGYTLDFWGAPGYATLPQVVIPLVGVAEAKPHVSLAPFGGRLGIPLAGVVILPSVPILAPGGRFSAKFTVPNNGALKGLKFYVQSLMGQPPNPVASFANLFPDQVQ